MRRDQHVIRTDDRSLPLKVGAKLSIVPVCLYWRREHFNHPQQLFYALSQNF